MHIRIRVAAAKPRLVSGGLLSLQLSLLVLLAFTAESFSTPVTASAATTQFSNKSFETSWQRVDQPVATAQTNRSWYWGPNPLAGGFYEPYEESPNSHRLVQYFDKARMEINDPDTNKVTNGLLVVEMITGRMQEGDNTFDEKALTGADVPIVGDLSNTFPTYRQLAEVYNGPENLPVGEPVEKLWGSQGASDTIYLSYIDDANTQIATSQNGFGIPQAFWQFMNRKGVVYSNGRFVNDLVTNWQDSVGLPVTEAYWTRVKVGGVDKDVLFQAFERRVLTYTPTNDDAYKVEMGNVGLHYVQWRYHGTLPQYTDPEMSIFDAKNPNQPPWYQSTTVLNIRTAPDSKAPQPINTKTEPFVTQLQAGDRIQVIRTVKGEEVDPGNDRWFQIYEKPDLFVYSEYTKPLEMPDFPEPPHSNKGMWVAVSIKAQMMAIYNNDTRIFTTLVATGRPGYETVKGDFRAIGGYRPLSQTMAGGNRASGDGYELLNIRNVTYFYTDFAIHGSYWHAKFGLVPQSHGCVNATVYDAGLIYQLPVGTPIQVY